MITAVSGLHINKKTNENTDKASYVLTSGHSGKQIR